MKNNLNKSNRLYNIMKDIVTNNIIYKQGERCSNEKERRERYLASHLRYATKPWICTYCDLTIQKGNKTKHLKSKGHLLRLSQ
jgi:ribosomal protein L37AE/L43A